MDQLEEEKGVSKEAVFEAIETSLAAAYKKEYGRKGQIVRALFDLETGKVEFQQVKIIVDETTVRIEEDSEEEDSEPTILIGKAATTVSRMTESEKSESEEDDEDPRPRYNPEHHIFLEDAQKIKKDAQLGDEIVFQLEERDDFGRIAAQTAKQVIIQKIREAERSSVMQEFGEREGEIVSGTVERLDRGAIFIDLGKATGIMAYEDQIPRERYRQGERIRGYLYAVEETPRGVSLRLSRSRPEFVKALFALEAPEISSGAVEIKAIAREPGGRSKMAVYSADEHIDPIGACVGQRGVRVTTVMSELGGEKIDIIEWSPDPVQFIAEALSPAKVENVEIREDEKLAVVTVDREQLSLAIGRNGQNARLAAKLSGWKIDIQSQGGEEEAYDPDEVKKEEKEATAKKEAVILETSEEESMEKKAEALEEMEENVAMENSETEEAEAEAESADEAVEEKK